MSAIITSVLLVVFFIVGDAFATFLDCKDSSKSRGLVVEILKSEEGYKLCFSNGVCSLIEIKKDVNPFDNRSFKIATKIEFAGLSLQKGTTVYLTSSCVISFVIPAADIKVRDMLLPKGQPISFFENLKLKQIVTKIPDIKTKEKFLLMAKSFREDGSEIMIKERIPYNYLTERGGFLAKYGEGRLEELGVEFRANGMVWPKHTYLIRKWYPDGNIYAAGAIIPANTKIEDQIYKKRTEFHFCWDENKKYPKLYKTIPEDSKEFGGEGGYFPVVSCKDVKK